MRSHNITKVIAPNGAGRGQPVCIVAGSEVYVSTLNTDEAFAYMFDGIAYNTVKPGGLCYVLLDRVDDYCNFINNEMLVFLAEGDLVVKIYGRDLTKNSNRYLSIVTHSTELYTEEQLIPVGVLYENSFIPFKAL